MAHVKRQSMPKSWPMPRKGTAYYGQASHDSNTSVPVVVALRDILKVVNTAREVKLMAMDNEIKVNEKVRRDERFPLGAFDVLSLDKMKKQYRLEIVGKKVQFKEVSGKEAAQKTVKISGKKSLANKTTQANLEDGSNYNLKQEFSVGDSAIVNLKENKVEKIVPLKEGAKVRVVSGKHAGKQGKVSEVVMINQKKNYTIKFNEGEVALVSKVLLAIE